MSRRAPPCDAPDPDSRPRRGFVKLCAGAAVAVGANPALLADGDEATRLYERVKLVRPGSGAAFTAEDIEVGESYVFVYPYVTTPCFLLDLGRPVVANGELSTEDGARYRWPGGVGPNRSIVAFAAICAHKMSHPARTVSFIDYRPERVRFRDADDRVHDREGVIYCCSEKSVYDPAEGARVLGGPAKQPLAAILLQEGTSGELWAIGTAGGEMYRRFFDTFAFRLALEHGTTDIERRVAGTSEVTTIEAYSETLMRC